LLEILSTAAFSAKAEHTQEHAYNGALTVEMQIISSPEGRSAEETLLTASRAGHDLPSTDCGSSSPSEPHLLPGTCPPHTVNQGPESAFNPIPSTVQAHSALLSCN